MPTATGAMKTARREPEPLPDGDREVRADGVERAVGEVDDAAQREDERQPERDQQVVGPREQAVEEVLDEEHEAPRDWARAARGCAHAILHSISSPCVAITSSDSFAPGTGRGRA